MVIFNTDTSLKKLDPERDMLCNITVDNKPIATARFMGGRDFDLISHSYRSPINRESIDYILGSDILHFQALQVEDHSLKKWVK